MLPLVLTVLDPFDGGVVARLGRRCLQLMHVAIHDEARLFVAASWPSRHVVGTFISPSHSSYVDNKMRRAGEQTMRFEERAALCDAAVADSDFTCVDRWEGSQVRAPRVWPRCIRSLRSPVL